MTDIQANAFQPFRHTRPAITARAEAGLFLDVGQGDQIRPLYATGGPTVERPQAPRADAGTMTKPLGWKVTSMFFDEPKSYCFRPAKNWVAFLMSLSSLKMQISRRSLSFS